MTETDLSKTFDLFDEDVIFDVDAPQDDVEDYYYTSPNTLGRDGASQVTLPRESGGIVKRRKSFVEAQPKVAKSHTESSSDHDISTGIVPQSARRDSIAGGLPPATKYISNFNELPLSDGIFYSDLDSGRRSKQTPVSSMFCFFRGEILSFT